MERCMGQRRARAGTETGPYQVSPAEWRIAARVIIASLLLYDGLVAIGSRIVAHWDNVRAVS